MQSENSDVCVLCCRKTDIFAFGVCDHPVCHECCTRMRVLLRKNECPICRQTLPQVTFSEKLRKFAVPPEKGRKDETYAVYFESAKTEAIFYSLLEHSCSFCPDNPVFPNFIQLKDHYRRTHERYYCNLCVDNIKLFSFERKSYTRQELATHRRRGDTDNTSLRGHPLCEFCDERYMDDDDLFRHLRKDHFFCHFCDAEGKHVFYCNYASLRDHFSQEHYLCEEGPCRQEQFTSVFQSDIDFRAHKALVHSKNLSKAKAKQARTLELDFPLKPRPRHHLAPYNDGGTAEEQSMQFRKKKTRESRDDNSLASGNNLQELDDTDRNPSPLNLSQDFPTLDGNPVSDDGGKNKKHQPPLSFAWNSATKDKSTEKKDESFPALSSATPVPCSDVWLSSHADASKIPSSSHSARTHSVLSKTQSEFPALELKNKKTKCEPANLPVTTGKQSARSSRKKKETPRSTTISELNDERFIRGKNEFPIAQTTSNDFVFRSAPSPTLTKEDFPELESTTGSVSNPLIVANAVDKGKKQTQTKIHSEKNRALPKQKWTNSVNNSSSKTDGFNLQEVANALKMQSPRTSAWNGTSNKKQISIAGPNERSESKNDNLNQNRFNAPASNGVTKHESVLFNRWKEQPSELLTRSNLEPLDTEQSSFNFLKSNVYTPPDNFQKRNIELIKKIKTSFNHSATSFTEFKAISGQFRQNLLPAESYYQKCTSLMGGKDFDHLFPELLVLLPDIKKQRELLQVHNCARKFNHANNTIQFLICATCDQVLSVEDFQMHKRVH